MASRSKTPFAISMYSGETAARDALRQVLNGLGSWSLSSDELGNIELVLAEVLNNIVEHAYPAGTPFTPVEISCSQDIGDLKIHILDHGQPMPDELLPRGAQRDLDVHMNDLPEGGFGWHLIRTLAKEVTYDRIGGQNHLTLRFSVAGDASTQQ